MAEKPRPTSSESEKELNKIEKQFDDFDKNVKEMTLDRMNQAPKLDREPGFASLQNQLEQSNVQYLKPFRTIPSREKFNEDYRKDYEYMKEYVEFVADNNEVKGETLDFWTKPFAGMPCEEWKVPVGITVSAPRYVKKRIDDCYYHQMSMKQNVSTGTDGMGQYYGAMVVDNIVQRLETHEAKRGSRVYMGRRFE